MAAALNLKHIEISITLELSLKQIQISTTFD
jgi:hypothetical protein